ncbi:hypothetical protein SAY86_025395 [Trapa natans]|uniref:GATA-type domain-containing protein n=1 Tax=Trapa natans TaxID=22666 RepID=A0AAN7RF07_TRANT|nr:hypothetical protein SAY86_025395 [Trapa natans]
MDKKTSLKFSWDQGGTCTYKAKAFPRFFLVLGFFAVKRDTDTDTDPSVKRAGLCSKFIPDQTGEGLCDSVLLCGWLHASWVSLKSKKLLGVSKSGEQTKYHLFPMFIFLYSNFEARTVVEQRRRRFAVARVSSFNPVIKEGDALCFFLERERERMLQHQDIETKMTTVAINGCYLNHVKSSEAERETVGQKLMDETADCSSFFNELFNFPVEDVEDVLPPATCESFPSIRSATQSDQISCSGPIFSSNSSTDLSAELSLPYEDIVQLEWLSNFVEDSFAGDGLTITAKFEAPKMDCTEPAHPWFHTSCSVSVLDSSSSSTSCSRSSQNRLPRSPDGAGSSTVGPRGRARSKRPRPATFSPWPAIEILPLTTDLIVPTVISPVSSSESDSATKSRPVKPPKKKIKSAQSPNPAAVQPVRKCLHCGITKTPQWRAGPMGPKTLCNACGVRYKSGRLFPEYRPAASPTFIPALHSNSHKKVLEMRSRGEGEDRPAVAIDCSI